jgi:hydrocephalus-inducing protein
MPTGGPATLPPPSPPQALPDSLDSDSDDDELGSSQRLVASPRAAALRAAAAARRRAALERRLFSSPHFAVFPPEGTVQPHSAFEVVVQFQPDFARAFEAAAYVEVQGREGRLPVSFSGQGLGPSVAFTYESLDVGDVYIHTQRQYTLELQNRGKVDAEWSLEPPGGPAGAQWAFEPAAGTLPGGETLLVRATLAAGVLGPFDEPLGCRVKGSGRVLELRLKGRVAGPDFEVDVRELELGTVGCGFRWVLRRPGPELRAMHCSSCSAGRRLGGG